MVSPALRQSVGLSEQAALALVGARQGAGGCANWLRQSGCNKALTLVRIAHISEMLGSIAVTALVRGYHPAVPRSAAKGVPFSGWLSRWPKSPTNSVNLSLACLILSLP